MKPYQNELNSALLAAEDSRKILTHYFGKLANVEEKKMAGLVSEADRESEIAIKNRVLADFPKTEFLGEEGAFLSGEPLNVQNSSGKLNEGLWVVDPLDGTTNYVHHFSIFCSSIALVQEGVPVVAVIDVPMLNQTFYSTKGGGAFLKDFRGVQQIHVSQRQELKSALVATGFFADHQKYLDEALQVFSRVIRKTRGIRRAGAAAYDLCMVASGVFDCFWERNLNPWDTAAGQLLVTEAGGLVTTYKNKSYHPWMNSILAGSPAIHPQMQKIIGESLDFETH